MLYHEIIRDDVPIRAESLSYFTLFSIMPIVAGLFLLVSAVSQWAPIQGDFQELIKKVLEPIPGEHRENLIRFIFEFKDVYLQKISQTGSSLGFFAIIVLVVIMAKVFMNIEDLMNRIWSSRENRPWGERIRNLILAMVILPTLLFTALSLPGVVEKLGGVKLGIWVERGLPTLLLFGGLFFLFRYFPNVWVRTKYALSGALFSTLLFIGSNSFLSIYFKFGTQTAYGKAAVIPLAAFFIYVSWLIIMIGAEWSFVLQNENRHTEQTESFPSLQEASVLVRIFRNLERRHQEGDGPVAQQDFYSGQSIPPKAIDRILVFLIQQGILVRVEVPSRNEEDAFFVLSRNPEHVDLIKTVKEFLKLDEKNQSFDVSGVLRLISAK